MKKGNVYSKRDESLDKRGKKRREETGVGRH